MTHHSQQHLEARDGFQRVRFAGWNQEHLNYWAGFMPGARGRPLMLLLRLGALVIQRERTFSISGSLMFSGQPEAARTPWPCCILDGALVRSIR